jgi:hypothetical protein
LRTDLISEQALKNLADDVTFIEKEVKRLEKPGLDDVFDEIKSVRKIASPRAKSLLYGSLDIHHVAAELLQNDLEVFWFYVGV